MKKQTVDDLCKFIRELEDMNGHTQLIIEVCKFSGSDFLVSIMEVIKQDNFKTGFTSIEAGVLSNTCYSLALEIIEEEQGSEITNAIRKA